VARTALVDRLQAAPYAPVVCVTAPPGYGKTTLLAQWAGRASRDVAWVSIEREHNDAGALLIDTARALDGVEPVEDDLFRALAAPGASTAGTAIARFSSTLSARTRPFRLVLDHTEALESQESMDVLAELSLRIPEGSQLAIASRGRPPLPAALLRSRRQMLELGVGDLAMDEQEAAALLSGAGVDLGPPDVTELVRRTEGWPAGLYLAALAMKNGGADGAAVAFTGDHRLMADYLRSEFLARLKPTMLRFLTRTSVLDRLSGPLCDAVLGSTRSAEVLELLESSNLLLVPLDDRRRWYRYHRLFKDLLNAQLEQDEPEVVPDLHIRAATWFEANGIYEPAIEHAQVAGDVDRAVRLVATFAQPAVAAGRMETALRWLRWFPERGVVAAHPQIAVLAAEIEAVSGHAAAAEEWAETAARGQSAEPMPDGSPFEAWQAFLRTLSCREGAVQMRVDADAAWELLAPGSQLRSADRLLAAMACLLIGDVDDADVVLAHAVEVAQHQGASPTVSMALAERATIAIDHGDWPAATSFAVAATELVEQVGLQDYLTSGLVYTVSARTKAHAGDIAGARDDLVRAARLRPLMTYAIPATAQVLLEMATAYAELADPAAARTVLRQVRDILRQRPDLGVIPARADELQARLASVRGATPGASSLTAAELRILPLLTTYLSLGGIAERLYLSRNTVKSQVISIYHKLGVSSRAEANARIAELGLLGS